MDPLPLTDRTIALRPKSERPRERLFRSGAHSLSLRECLAILFGSGPKGKGCLGVAEDLLRKIYGSSNIKEEQEDFFQFLESDPPKNFFRIPGLGPANQARLLVVIELIRRARNFQTQRNQTGNFDPLDKRAIRKVSNSLRHSKREWIGFVPVYHQNRVGSICVIENGTRTHVNFDPADLFSAILNLRPQSFFLFHNHPSGNLTPSREDILLTESVSFIAGLMNIRMNAHYIVSAHSERRIKIDV